MSGWRYGRVMVDLGDAISGLLTGQNLLTDEQVYYAGNA